MELSEIHQWQLRNVILDVINHIKLVLMLNYSWNIMLKVGNTKGDWNWE